MQIGDKVLVPRTGGGNTPGEIIEIYTDHARVKFHIGDYFRGKPALPGIRSEYGYKTLRQDALKAVES